MLSKIMYIMACARARAPATSSHHAPVMLGVLKICCGRSLGAFQAISCNFNPPVVWWSSWANQSMTSWQRFRRGGHVAQDRLPKKEVPTMAICVYQKRFNTSIESILPSYGALEVTATTGTTMILTALIVTAMENELSVS